MAGGHLVFLSHSTSLDHKGSAALNLHASNTPRSSCLRHLQPLQLHVCTQFHIAGLLNAPAVCSTHPMPQPHVNGLEPNAKQTSWVALLPSKPKPKSVGNMGRPRCSSSAAIHMQQHLKQSQVAAGTPTDAFTCVPHHSLPQTTSLSPRWRRQRA